MDTKEVKAGEKYKLELLCIHNTGKVIMFETPTGDHLPFRESDLDCVSPAAPKYDPCRKFRNGDRVRVVENKGRCLKPHALKIGDVLTVSRDETNDDTFVIWCKRHDRDFYIDPSYLELVTPVEELEPYIVETCQYGYTVNKGELILATYNDETHPNAKAAAEAECARLNAEYIKEQSND